MSAYQSSCVCHLTPACHPDCVCQPIAVQRLIIFNVILTLSVSYSRLPVGICLPVYSCQSFRRCLSASPCKSCYLSLTDRVGLLWQSLSVSINLLGMPHMFVSLPLQTIRYKSDRPCRSVGQSLSVNTKPSCHSVYVWQSLSACRSDPVCRTAPACSSISACLPTPVGHYRLWRLAYCTVALNIF